MMAVEEILSDHFSKFVSLEVYEKIVKSALSSGSGGTKQQTDSQALLKVNEKDPL